VHMPSQVALRTNLLGSCKELMVAGAKRSFAMFPSLK